MAQQIEYEVMGIQLLTAYLMVGDVVLHARDKTAEIFVYIFSTEAARTANDMLVTREAVRIFVPREKYQEFFEKTVVDAQTAMGAERQVGMEIDDLIIWAAYELLKAYNDPIGMKELFDTGSEV